MPHPHAQDSELLHLLQRRDGVATVVVLRDGRRMVVYDIAWGYDLGDEWAHVTTNISPGRAGASVDVFSTGEVVSVIDPDTGNVICALP